MFKKILVPTDSSEFSRKALRMALDLAKTHGSEIELITVQQAVHYYDIAITMTDEELIAHGKRILKITTQDLPVDTTLKEKVIIGTPVLAILEEIEKEDIDLVIMGQHGYGAITGTIMGSVSLRVLHRTKCPVLIVK